MKNQTIATKPMCYSHRCRPCASARRAPSTRCGLNKLMNLPLALTLTVDAQLSRTCRMQPPQPDKGRGRHGVRMGCADDCDMGSGWDARTTVTPTQLTANTYLRCAVCTMSMCSVDFVYTTTRDSADINRISDVCGMYFQVTAGMYSANYATCIPALYC